MVDAVLLPIHKADYADRKEMVEGLFGWLTPEEQLAFLNWCVTQLRPIFRGTSFEGPVVGGKKECWLWMCILCTDYGLDFEAARLELERRVREANPPKEAQRRVRTGGLTWPLS